MQALVRGLSLAAAVFVLTPAASAVTIDWAFVGNPGNGCDLQSQGCFGAVGYAYNIGTYEVTNAQYAEFLNAKAASDPLSLYSPGMAHATLGGITRSGSAGSYVYTVNAGRGDFPVAWVTFFDAMRFANWLHNGQGSGDTEAGAYTLLGGTPLPSNSGTVTRNAGATIFLPSENEWYKAAYYSALSTSYFDYPSGSDTVTTCAAPTATPKRANCNNAVGFHTTRGGYTGSASPYGTFDQGGNVYEWNETLFPGARRGSRGGAYNSSSGVLGAAVSNNFSPTDENQFVGFRMASIPEPRTGLLVMGGLLAVAARRTRRTQL